MGNLGCIHNSQKELWIFFLSLLLVACLASVTRAQDGAPTEEPTLVPANTPTEDPADLVSPTLTHTLTISTTPTPLEPTVLATVPSITPASPTPALTLTPPMSTTTPTPLEPTVLATVPSITPASATPTLTFTPIPPPPRLGITANETRLPENDTLLVMITAEDLPNVYQMALTCQTNPTILRGIQTIPGDLLPGELIILSESGIQTNGQWHLTGTQINLAPELPNTGVLWYLMYQVIGNGITPLTCWMEFAEYAGQTLSMTIPSVEVTIEGYQTDDSVPLPVENVRLSGYVQSSLPLENATVTMANAAMQETIAIANDGAFAFALPSGDYQMTVNALRHLPFVLEVAISEQPLALPVIVLTGGDVDGNAVIDSADVALITQHYGFTVPPATQSLDLNGDAVIDLLDLTIVSANLNR